MRTFALLGLFLQVALTATAQPERRMAERHQRIVALYEAGNYAETIREVDLQLAEAPGTTWQDSVHRYLYKYGRAYRKVKDAAAGVAAAERLYAMVKQRGNANHELEALFDLSWMYYDVGELKQCARVDSIAITVADADPAVPITQRGRARQYLAFDYSVMGDHGISAKYALEALAQYAKADTVPAVQWAESYTAVGVAYWHLGRIRDAERNYLKAMEVLGDGTDEATLVRKVTTNGNLGVLWQNAGDLTRARNYYHESLRNSDRVIASATDPFTRDEAIINRSRGYLNLATVYFQLGDDGRARELLDIAWKDRSSVLEPDDPQLLVVKDRIADIELAQGSLQKAGELVEAYLSACEAKFGPRSEEYVRASSKLGEIAMRKGEMARADSLYQVSMAAGGQGIAEGTDVVLALTLQRRARLRLIEGRYADARTDLLQARRIMASTYDGTHYKVAAVDVLLAEAAYLGGDAKAALGYAHKALGNLAERIQVTRISQAQRAFADPHILPDALYWKVSSERALPNGGRKFEDWNGDLDLAIGSLARSRIVALDEASKLLLVGAQKRLFDLALDVAYEAYEASGAEADLERFLLLSEADRSILLKSRLGAFVGLRFAGVPDTVITREQELIIALEISEGDRAAATDLDERERAYAEFIARLERDHPAYFDLRYGGAAITLTELRKQLLTDDRSLLAYALTDEHLYTLVVGSSHATLVRSSSAGIADLVRALNGSIAERNTVAYTRAAYQLYQAVVAPVVGQLQGSELLVIPDGPLHAVNFETLLTAPSTPKDLRNNLLLQRYAMAYLLSATTAVRFAELARKPSNDVLAIAPGFSDELKRDYVASLPDTALVDRNFLHYVRQPFAMRTAQGLGGTLQARVMLGGEATEKGFRASVNDYGILHLGTHAEMNATSPLYSRLVLSKDGSGIDPDTDGYLHAYEIYELDLRAQLTVLTACETGAGRADGEGVRSLGYSFAYAGCPSLVMSLWSIDEKVSAEIIERFYGYLAEGLPKHQALRQAKLDHLASAEGELLLPYYWAGLVLVGDVAPVNLPTPWMRYLIWLAAFALIGALLWYTGRSRAAGPTK